MQVILKIPADIPEKTLNELAKRAAEELVNDERDIVQVVRCKDCRRWRRFSSTCSFHGDAYFDEDDYCSRGERRDEA